MARRLRHCNTCTRRFISRGLEDLICTSCSCPNNSSAAAIPSANYSNVNSINNDNTSTSSSSSCSNNNNDNKRPKLLQTSPVESSGPPSAVATHYNSNICGHPLKSAATSNDDPIVLDDDDDKIDDYEEHQDDDDDDDNDDEDGCCSEGGDDINCTQIMADEYDDDDIDDDDDDDMDNAPLSLLLVQSKSTQQQQPQLSSPRKSPLHLVDLGPIRQPSPITNNINKLPANVGERQHPNNNNIVDLMNDDDNEVNQQTDTTATTTEPLQQPTPSSLTEMTITLQNNNNINNSNNNNDLSTCSVCGASLIHIVTWNGRLNHMKRCSKQHGMTARDVAYNDDHEVFASSSASCLLTAAATNNNNNSHPNTAPTASATAAATVSLNKWHGNAEVELKLQKQQSSSNSSTKKQETDALSMLMAGARRAAKQAKLLTAKASATTAPSTAGRGGGGGGGRASWRGGGYGGGGRGGGGGTFGQKNYACPAYKKISGTNFVVDGFQYASSLSAASSRVNIASSPTYFLTHFHSDHYGGITRTWNAGVIYCSQPTANLVHFQLGVDRQYLHPLPFNVPIEIATMSNRGVQKSVTVTSLHANHCPGAAMMLFEIPMSASSSVNNNNSKKRRILHVGDFRWNRSVMLGTSSSNNNNNNNNNPLLALATAAATGNEQGRLDELFLDTTYCDAKYTLPTQAAAIAATVEYAVEQVQLAQLQRQRILLLFGTYTIGKERIYLAVAEKLGMKVYVDQRRFKILSAVMGEETEWPLEKLSSLLTTNPAETVLWTAPLGHITMKKLPEYLQVKIGKFTREFTKVVGFRPTGWSMSTGKKAKPVAAAQRGRVILRPQTRGKVTTVGVPYSEHSAFNELVDCLDCLRPRKITPTVSVSKSEQQVDLLLTHLQRKDRTRLDQQD